MARTKISEYSATAADNTDINSINIAEGCAPSGINNAIREMMKQLKDFQAGTSGDSFTNSNVVLTGGSINGTTIGASTPSTGAFTNLSYTGTLTGGTGVLNIGSGQIYKDASGNVGIGTSSPADKLDILGGGIKTNGNGVYTGSASQTQTIFSGTSFNTGGAAIAIRGSSAGFNNHGMEFYAGGSERLRIDSSGNVGIGTSSPSVKLDVVGSGKFTGVTEFTNAINLTTSTLNYVYFNDAIAFSRNGTGERARIDSSGNLLVGRTNRINSGRVETLAAPNEQAFVAQVQTNANSVFQGFNSSGTAVFVATGDGNLTITGNLTKGSGSFRIDHPLKPDTHHLVHSFVEAPQADNIYRGKATLINGRVEVNIDETSGMTDGTFVALNRQVQCFTSNESGWDAVRGSVNGNILTIECQNSESTATVSWLVIGERQDNHMYETDWTDENGKVIVEPVKSIQAQLNSGA